MYMHWTTQRYAQRKPTLTRDPEDESAWLAEWETTVTRSVTLVQSRRGNGQPRQRVVAWLGSVSDSHTFKQRRRFWQRASGKLNALVMDGTLTPLQQTDRTVQLACVVPPLTDADIADYVGESIRVARETGDRDVVVDMVDRLTAEGCTVGYWLRWHHHRDTA